jgi:hypothetical protein
MCSASGVRGNWTSDEVFDQINLLLDRLASEDLNSMPAAVMGDHQIKLQRIGNRLKAEALRRLRRFDGGQGYASTLAISAKGWLRWKCNLTYPAASGQVEVARALDSLPKTTQAFADGDISYHHASLIARTSKQLGDKMEAHAETILVEAAKKLDPFSLRKVTGHLRHCLQPDEVLRDANEAHEKRFLFLSQTMDGVFYLNGRLDAEGGAILQTALNSVMGPPPKDDDRTARQRRADAAVEMCRRQLDGGQLPEVAGQKPHLVVNVEMGTLSKEPGSRAADLEWAHPIPAETARRLACDSAITPIVEGEVDHTSRAVPGAIRRALVARDKGCRVPGCDCPAAWTDAHHVKHWADGGPTTLPNLMLLCRRHHRRFHEEGLMLNPDLVRELAAIPP